MDEEEPILEVETPPSLLPDLGAIGIEEVDRGVCEDTFENRRILREHKYRWQTIFNTDGTMSPHIQVITPEMNMVRAERKKIILEDDRNMNSDYITGYRLVTNGQAKEVVPSWVLASTNYWIRVDQTRKDTNNKNYRPAIAAPPGRCIARKLDGSRCLNWHNGMATDGFMCRMHMARTNNNAEAHHLERARNRLRTGTMAALETLEELMLTATSEPVRQKAADSWLDRVGLRGGIEIDANVNGPSQAAGEMLAQRLAELTGPKKSEDTIEAEVVEDDH
jgi:hypothetical protein